MMLQQQGGGAYVKEIGRACKTATNHNADLQRNISNLVQDTRLGAKRLEGINELAKEDREHGPHHATANGTQAACVCVKSEGRA